MRMLAAWVSGTAVPDGTRAFPVANESLRGACIDGHALGAAGKQRLSDVGATEDGLERAHVLVFASVRGGHQSQLLAR